MRHLFITPLTTRVHPYQVRGLTELGRSVSRAAASVLTAQQARLTQDPRWLDLPLPDLPRLCLPSLDSPWLYSPWWRCGPVSCLPPLYAPQVTEAWQPLAVELKTDTLLCLLSLCVTLLSADRTAPHARRALLSLRLSLRLSLSLNLSLNLSLTLNLSLSLTLSLGLSLGYARSHLPIRVERWRHERNRDRAGRRREHRWLPRCTTLRRATLTLRAG